MTAGMMLPIISRVCVLNWFTNSPMLIPVGPSAVPTGGAGVAFPAGSCIFNIRVTFFAILFYLYPLYLIRFEFHWSLAAEHRNHDFNLSARFVNFPDLALQILERAVNDEYGVVDGEVDGVLGHAFVHLREDAVHFRLGERHRLVRRTDESRNLRRVAHDAPCIICRDHVDEYVPGEYLLAHLGLAPTLYFYLLFHWNDDVEYLLFHTERIDALAEITGDSIFIAGIRMDRIPPALCTMYLFSHTYFCVLGASTGSLVMTGMPPVASEPGMILKSGAVVGAVSVMSVIAGALPVLRNSSRPRVKKKSKKPM